MIPLGIDLGRFRTLQPAGLAVHEAIRATASPPVILFVGRFVYYKGLDVLINAMARCTGTLILVGDGPLDIELRAQVAALGIGSRVRFAGQVPDHDLPAYYHASDIFVLPSVARTEAYGLVQTEAMAAGVPVVSTNLPTGVPWVNQDGVTGLVVPPGEPDALAAALGALAANPALRRTLGDNGRRRAVTLFSRDRTIEAFRNLVETTVRAPELLDRLLPHAEPSRP